MATPAKARTTVRRVPLVGCAGWGVPRIAAGRFPAEGTWLQRYARIFGAVEINSSFYRPHRAATYARWADSVPAAFRFSVKVPKAITHHARLVSCGPLLDTFMSQVCSLGPKLGCLLIQLPPSLVYSKPVATAFFADLRERHCGAAVLEPRHPSWFSAGAERLLADFRIGRAAADPAKPLVAAEPGGSQAVVYFRLHGTPVMYRSAYDGPSLAALALRLERYASAGTTAWCIFDNTTLGYATVNALELGELVASPPGIPAAGPRRRQGFVLTRDL